MKLYGIEKLSLVDFDGVVASTVFTGKCNYRCSFCHNSPLVENVESLSPIDVEKEVFSYLEKRKGVIEGVCVTGGEPTLEKDLPLFLERIKKMGLKVKLDSNGTNTKMIGEIAKNNLADYFAMDIKNSKEKYGEIIGIDNYNTENVEKTVEFFLSNDYDYEFRTTLIKEYHTLEDIKKIGEWIKGAKKYFMQKFKSVDTCIKSGLNEIDNQTALTYLEEIKKHIPNAKLRGYDIT